MTTKDEMEKGTKIEDLVKMRKERLDPIREEMKTLEGELALLQQGVPCEGTVA